MLNAKYPKVIRNEQVYDITKALPWSIQIGKRRITWFGHVNRLHEDTPARRALRYALQDYKRKRGRPKLTWLKLVENQLRDVGDINELITLAQDRGQWDDIVKNWLQNVALAT